MMPVKIYFYRHTFNRFFATFDQLGLDRLNSILPSDIKVLPGDDERPLADADAVVVDIPHMQSRFRREELLSMRPGLIKVGWNLESVGNYPWVDSPEIRGLFDLFMGYRLDSDVVMPYLDPSFSVRLKNPPAPKSNEKKVCMMISSPVNGSKRFEYLEELMEYIEIDSYGRWRNNKTIPGDRGYLSKRETMRGYKFSIAFENSISEDYVTEKFFDPLIAGSVPVYLGAPNIDRFAPGADSFINAGDYPEPRQLAGVLNELCADDKSYSRFVAWKSKPLNPELSSLIAAQKVHPFIRLADKIRELKKRRETMER